jgi:hypothetical protein
MVDKPNIYSRGVDSLAQMEQASSGKSCAVQQLDLAELNSKQEALTFATGEQLNN